MPSAPIVRARHPVCKVRWSAPGFCGAPRQRWTGNSDLENTTTDTPARLLPSTGAVVRVNQGAAHETIASGLMFPTGMTFGPDGALHVSTHGFGPAGAGLVERIAIPPA